MTRYAPLVLWLASAFAVGCTDPDVDAEDGSGLIDSQVVVQESNLPPLECEVGETAYVMDVERPCNDDAVEASLCADAPLCDDQLAAIWGAIASCESVGPFDSRDLPVCPPN
jgi:hypothetical protein